MRVPDNQGQRLSVIAHGPFFDDSGNRGSYGRLARAGINQQGFLTAEKKIQERLLIIDAAVFPQYVEVGVVSVNLPFGRVIACGPTGAPGFGKLAGANAAAIGLRRLCPTTSAQQPESQASLK